MNIFVAGAAGVIGRRLVPALLEAGHRVTGMTRSAERAQELRDAGATPAVCDVYDVAALGPLVRDARPEVVVHQLTALPADYNPRTNTEPTDRLRGEGTANLVCAAQAAGARRIVAQSIAFAYAPRGGAVKGEDEPLFVDAPGHFARSVAAVASLERQTTEADGLEGVALRYGFFYGAGTQFASDGSAAREVRRRRYPIVGAGTGVFSFIHIDDGASATVAAVERGAPGIYNVVDDEPAAIGEWLPVYAEALGAPRPLRVPKFVARIVAGPVAVSFASEMRGASNAKAKRALGWSPSHASWRDGFAAALG